jgi:hypothetical protein
MDGLMVFLLAAQVIICLCTGALAVRKGYSFAAWFFAGGVYIQGLIVLAVLGYTNKGDVSAEVATDRRKTGNLVGVVLSVFGVLAIVYSVALMLRLGFPRFGS